MRAAVRAQRARRDQGRDRRPDRRSSGSSRSSCSSRRRPTSPRSRRSRTAPPSCSARSSATPASTPARPSASPCCRSTSPSRSRSSSRSVMLVSCARRCRRLVEQARAYAGGGRTPAEPRDAATVVLLRDANRHREVYLLRRQTSMAFAAGMCVFPGGGVDPRDFDAAVAWAGRRPPSWAAARLRRAAWRAPGVRRRAGDVRGVRRAAGRAVRRLGGRHHRRRTGRPTGSRWRRAELSLPTSWTGAGWCCAPTCSARGSGWLTPEFEPRRYRTWFFVAALPEGSAPGTCPPSRRPGRLDGPGRRGRGGRRRRDGDAAADVPDLRRGRPHPTRSRRCSPPPRVGGCSRPRSRRRGVLL